MKNDGRVAEPESTKAEAAPSEVSASEPKLAAVASEGATEPAPSPTQDVPPLAVPPLPPVR